MKKNIIWILATTLCLSIALPAHTLAAENGRWETISQEDGFLTQRKSVEGSNIFAFRGETVANVTIAKILKVFLDSSTRKNWVAMFGGSEDLENPTPLDRTYWIRFNTPIPTSDRDYILRAVGEPNEAKRIFLTKIESVVHPKKGEQDCCVRGQAFGTFYRFTAIPGTKTTKVEVEVHTDPKGWIPGWVTNLVQKKWPKNTLMSLIKVASEASVTEHPDYTHWHDVAAPEPKEPAAEETKTGEEAKAPAEAPAETAGK